MAREPSRVPVPFGWVRYASLGTKRRRARNPAVSTTTIMTNLSALASWTSITGRVIADSLRVAEEAVR